MVYNEIKLIVWLTNIIFKGAYNNGKEEVRP